MYLRNFFERSQNRIRVSMISERPGKVPSQTSIVPPSRLWSSYHYSSEKLSQYCVSSVQYSVTINLVGQKFVSTLSPHYRQSGDSWCILSKPAVSCTLSVCCSVTVTELGAANPWPLARISPSPHHSVVWNSAGNNVSKRHLQETSSIVGPCQAHCKALVSFHVLWNTFRTDGQCDAGGAGRAVCSVQTTSR